MNESESRSVMSYSLWPHGLNSPWDSPGKNTRVGSHSLFQGIFSTQGSNLGLLHCTQILYQLSHQESHNTGVDSLFLLQQISPTQELNPGLLHCRQILHWLSYEGSLPHALHWGKKEKKDKRTVGVSNMEEKRTLSHCWQKCKLMKPPMKSSLEVPLKN